MMFRVRCKACQHFFRVPDDKAGVPIHCPYCRNPIVIRPPAAVGADSSASSARTQQPPSPANPPSDDEEDAILLTESDDVQEDTAGVAPSARRARRVGAIFVDCRSCGQRMQISSRDLGKAVQCASCKAVMKVELPTVEASLGASVEIDDDDPVSDASALTVPGVETIAAAGSFARRRAHARGNVGEKIFLGMLILGLLGGMGWLGHHFLRMGPSPLRSQPEPTPTTNSPAGTTAPDAKPIVDTYSWVDAANPSVWDAFLDATWGVAPSEIPNLKPTEPPSALFDAGNLKWYAPDPRPETIGPANIQDILYAFLEQDGTLRLCEIRLQCHGTGDCEELQKQFTKRYGPAAVGDNPFAAVEWRGKTSAGRDVVIEVGGKVASFSGTQIRSAIQDVR
ncbi:MAG: hypothetical protein JXA11_00480 [Phycisphaerae bacterium]|nr:hypothetical protein [Phycisphaerae bacterium]